MDHDILNTRHSDGRAGQRFVLRTLRVLLLGNVAASFLSVLGSTTRANADELSDLRNQVTATKQRLLKLEKEKIEKSVLAASQATDPIIATGCRPRHSRQPLLVSSIFPAQARS